MDQFKLASWNIEHADDLLTKLASSNATTKRKAERRRDAVAQEIAGLEADILLISEGPNGEARAAELFAQTAPGYRLITRGSDDAADYGMKGANTAFGRQWLWFLVRKDRPITASLQHLDRWRDYTAAASGGEHLNGKWAVSFPKWQDDDSLQFSIPESHSHWRHPQVLQVEIAGQFLEIIGCHLKSKFNSVKATGDSAEPDFFDRNRKLVAELIKARVKLTTEATDLRHYIDARFAEDDDAGIIVAGDLNDGPGKERIERRFIYHDLIGSLQGDIFFARRFLNHALFDLTEAERWSVFFEDALDPGRSPHILLDHIVFSQSMTRSHTGKPHGYVARPRGGMVEHEVHHRVASQHPKYAATSDHKAVSMVFDRRITPVA